VPQRSLREYEQLGAGRARWMDLLIAGVTVATLGAIGLLIWLVIWLGG
jgi:hypothetical protein